VTEQCATATPFALTDPIAKWSTWFAVA